MSESDMEDSMREIYAEIEEADEPEETGTGRPRDEHGRFAPKVTEEAVADDEPAEDPETETEAVLEDVAEVEEDIEEPEDAVVTTGKAHPPAEWTATAKSMWNDIPPRIQQEILKREGDVKNGIQTLKSTLDERAAFGEKMQSVVSPYQALIAAEGGTPEGAVREMLNSAFILRQGSVQQKLQMTLQLAQRYGFGNELVAIIRGKGQNLPIAPARDPRVDALERKIAEQDRRVSEQSQQSVMQAIESFQNATDEAGQLEHPYFENVRPYMIALLQSGQHETLEDAYEAAIWTHPETRDVMLAAQKAAVTGQRQDIAKDRATKARKANKVNLPKRGNHESRPAKPTGSIEDTMRETLAALNG